MDKLDVQSKTSLLTLPRVVGVGYGYKIVGGIQTNQEAIVVLVSEKLLPKQITFNLMPLSFNILCWHSGYSIILLL